MKRRCKSNIKYPLTISCGDIARNRGFEKPSDMRKAKRVRFDDTEMDDAPGHASSGSGGREAPQSPRCGGPKTSEYAYFKKLKNGPVHGHSHAMHKENEQLKSSKINYLSRETLGASNKLKSSTKGLNVSVSEERAGPSDHNLFLSPNASEYDESHQIKSEELTNQIRKRTSLLPGSATPVGQCPFSSPLNEALEKSESQCSVEGIFTEKRLRLRQLVAHTCSEAEKLHAKGFDLVSWLLSRLIPKGSENNDSSKGDADNNTKSLTFHESNNLENGLHLSHRRDWDKDLPKLCSGQSSDIVLKEWDSFVPGFSSYCIKNIHPQDESIDRDQFSESRVCRSSETQHGFYFRLPYESCRSSGSFHFKDLDEFGSSIEHEREPFQPLLKWKSELGNDRINSSIDNHEIEMSMHARLPSAWNVDKPIRVDDAMWPSSFFSNHYLESNAYGSDGGLMHAFGPDIDDVKHGFVPDIDDVKFAMAEPQEFSLVLPYTPTWAEDKYAEKKLCGSNIIFSHGDQGWVKKKIWDGKPLTEVRWKCLSDSDFTAEEDYPSVWQFPENENGLYSLPRLKKAPKEETFTPLCEGAFIPPCFLSPSLHSSLDTFINRPLLLNHVNHGSPDQELSFEDYGNELGYRKLLL